MRTFKATLLFLAVFFLVTPAPAQAWFGWLDDLSGPGPFWGEQYEVRVACVGDVDKTTKNLAKLLFTAKVLTYRVYGSTPAPAPVIDASRAAWASFHDALDIDPIHNPVFSEGANALNPSDIKNFNDALSASIFAPNPSGVTPTANEIASRQAAPNDVQIPDSAADLIKKALLLVEESYKANVSINSTGMAWSLCSPGTTRRLALELGLTFWQANSRPEFAKDYTIRLTTLMPSISYRLFTDPRHDFIDMGAGAGIYWFSSRGFNTFSGFLLQPLRVDFHGPTQWVNDGGIKAALGLITLRAALMGFPAGFKAGAFAGVGDKARAIPGEYRPTVTIFFDVAALLRRPKLDISEKPPPN